MRIKFKWTFFYLVLIFSLFGGAIAVAAVRLIGGCA